MIGIFIITALIWCDANFIRRYFTGELKDFD